MSIHRDLASAATAVSLAFERQAAQTPAALAAVQGGDRLTFAQINARANQLAYVLRLAGVGAERRAGILLEPCIDLIVAVLAVLKAGGAFVPIDPNAPSERVTYMLQDAGAVCVLTQSSWRATLREAAVRCVALDEEQAALARQSIEDLGLAIDPDQLAYVIYTSGSTGRPKGVMVSHAGLMRYLAWCADAYRTGGAGAPVHSSVAADLTITSLLAPLLAGEPIVLLPQSGGVTALASALRARPDFSFVKLTPTHLRLLAREQDPASASASTRALIVGGEALYGEDLAFWRTHAPDTRVINEYGPTEAVVGCCVVSARAADVAPGPVPIGHPITHATLYVRDERLQPVAPGVTGELYIGGAALARGYLGRPDLTADRFVPDPFGGDAGARLYRTGDLVRQRADGTFEFVGRRDGQLKIHGYRVELGEIEHVLAEQDDVESAIVAATTDAGDDRRLVAYVVARPDRAPDVEHLRDFLGARLPSYMIPAAFLVLDRFPVLPNGKVDRLALPSPDDVKPAAGPYVRPRTAEEEVLAGIWSQVLHLDRVGIDDNYFVLGGDSIRTLQVVALAQERGLTLSLDDVFQYPTVRQLAAAVSASQTTGALAPLDAFALIDDVDRRRLPADIVDAYPLSLLQSGMIYHMELSPESAIYHDINSFHIQAPLDFDSLCVALGRVIARHPILRTSFDLANFSQPLQLVHASADVVLSVIDVRDADAAAQGAAIDRWFEEEKARGFAWSALPLIRFCVHLRGADVWQFTVSFHHAILDGWSEATMLAELFQQYISIVEGREIAIEPPAIQYRDFVRLERESVDSPEAQAFWEDALRGHVFAPMPRWRTPRPGRRTFLIHEIPIPDDVSDGLKRTAMLAAVPVKDVLLAAHMRVMSLLAGSPDVVTSVVSSGRPEQLDGDRVLGLFINSLPIRLRVTGGTWLDLAAAVFDVERDALPHRRYPMAELKWREGRRVFSETLFYFTHFHVYEALQRFPAFTLLGGQLYEQASFLLCTNCRVDPFNGQIFVTVKYDANQLVPEQIAGLDRYYATTLTAMARDPHGRHDAIDLLAADERRQLLVDWNAAPALEAGGPSVVDAFEAQADRTPALPAVVDTELTLTYAELDARANQLARHLRALGVGPEARVAICLERSAAFVLSALAILKAGGAFLAIDPAYPTERMAFLLDDSHAAAVVSHGRLAGRVPPGTRCVRLDADAEVIARAASDRLALAIDGDRVASVIYTSGSTGEPKGVESLHRGIATLIRDLNERCPLPPGARYSALASVTFDASILEIFSALLSGGALFFAPDAIRADGGAIGEWLAGQRIEGAFAAPAVLDAFADWAGRHPGRLALTRLITGAESVDARLTSQILERVPGLTLLNGYGPTEASVFSTVYDLRDARGLSGPAPIGRPWKDRVYVLDAQQRLTPVGVAGEICIGGPGLARGYQRRPALTAERFVPDPISGVAGARLYRTGDRGRVNADGLIEFLGRLDAQVKIRGYRVEPGEIETLLAAQPGVRHAAVIVREDQPGDKRLVAYVERESGDAPDARDLRGALARLLPEYMVPGAFVFLPALPLTARDKVDRAALAASDARPPEASTPYAAPRSAAEETIAAIWSDVLRIDAPGIHDNFFEAGGHSLLATRLVAVLREAFQIHLPLAAIFDTPTIAGLAYAVTRAQAPDTAASVRYTPLPALVTDEAHRYDPFPLTDVQQAYWIGRNAGFELGDLASHGYLEFDAPGLDLARLTQTVRALIARHDMLRAIVRPDGRQQVLRDVPPYEIDTVDLRGLPADVVEERLAQVRARLSRHAFQTDRWPLFELRAHLLDGDRTRLHVSLDPVTMDADSIGMMGRELTRLYAEPDAVLEPLAITFRDYVLAELALRESDRYHAARAYWLRRLDALPPAPDLPMTPREERVDKAFAGLRLELAPAVWTRLKTRAARRGVTPSGLLFAAYADVLAAWSASPRFTINVTTYHALPLHPQVRHLVGDFTTLTLVAVDARAAAFEARARAVQRQFLDDLEHAAFSGIQVLRELARRRNDALRAAMPVVFTSTLPLHTRPTDRQAPLPFALVTAITQTPQTVLDHQVSELDGTLTTRWDYLAAAFPPGVIQDMFDAYHRLLLALAGEDDTTWTQAEPVLRLPASQARVRAAVNATDAPRVDEALHAGVVRQIAARPDAIAIITPTRTLRYADLGREAAAVAAALRARGVGAELVGVVSEKDWEQVVAVLGVLEAGAAYLPVDARWPRARQWDVLRRGGVRVVLTQPAVDARTTWPDEVERIVLHAGGGVDDPLRGTCLAPTARAYVIFTSGSTGEPKGVTVDHAAAMTTIADINRRWTIDASDRVLGVSALSFDLSVYDIFGVLGAGGTLVLPDPDASRDPDAWLASIARHDVTLWNSVPALFELLVEAASRQGNDSALPASLRLALLSGDWIPVTLPARARALSPSLEIVSLGGATEAAIWSIAHPIDAVASTWTSIPYGRPLASQTWRIVDAQGSPSPDWVPGHLAIGGAGLAQGYWQDPVRTAERFVPDPDAGAGARMYRTGDRGRYWPDGTIEFLGRTDAQVKVHGHRIELGEIEATLAQHPAVRQAAALALGPRQGPKHLAAYVVLGGEDATPPTAAATLDAAVSMSDVAHANGRPSDAATLPTLDLPAFELLEGPMLDELREYLSARLPDYMVPKSVVRLTAIPLTANGKIDRQTLPALDAALAARATSPGAYRPPQTDVECQIAGIWQELLHVSRVGLDDSFLVLGGHSLLAMELVARLRDAFGVQLPLRAVFEQPTVEALAALVLTEQIAATAPEDVEAMLAEVEGLSIDEARTRLTLPD